MTDKWSKYIVSLQSCILRALSCRRSICCLLGHVFCTHILLHASSIEPYPHMRADETGGIALVGKPLIDIRKEQTGDVPAAFKTLMQSPSMENFPPKLSTPPGKDMKENETQRPDVSVKQQGSAASTQVYAHAKQAPTTHFLDSSGKPIATPAVRHMAREHGVDLFNLRSVFRSFSRSCNSNSPATPSTHQPASTYVHPTLSSPPEYNYSYSTFLLSLTSRRLTPLTGELDGTP